MRTISGVATSITAFIGRALRGPVDQPMPINNFGDFERAFGGLDSNYPMGFAVRQFYQNGGSRALIVRVWVAPPPGPAPAANADGVATATVGGLNLVASSRGEWGNRLSVEVNRDGLTDAAAQALGYPSATALFNLTIQLDRLNGPRETFLGVSVVDGPRRVDRILEQSSQYDTVHGPGA